MPDLVVPPYLLADALSYLTLGGAGYLAWRLVRAYERRTAAGARLRALTERVRRLEAAVDAVEASVRQTADAQRLAATLVAARAALPRDEPRA